MLIIKGFRFIALPVLSWMFCYSSSASLSVTTAHSIQGHAPSLFSDSGSGSTPVDINNGS